MLHFKIFVTKTYLKNRKNIIRYFIIHNEVSLLLSTFNYNYLSSLIKQKKIYKSSLLCTKDILSLNYILLFIKKYLYKFCRFLVNIQGEAKVWYCQSSV